MATTPSHIRIFDKNAQVPEHYYLIVARFAADRDKALVAHFQVHLASLSFLFITQQLHHALHALAKPHLGMVQPSHSLHKKQSSRPTHHPQQQANMFKCQDARPLWTCSASSFGKSRNVVPCSSTGCVYKSIAQTKTTPLDRSSTALYRILRNRVSLLL